MLDTRAQVPVWTIVANMERPRIKLPAVAVWTDIYIFGGGIPEIDKISVSIIKPVVATAPLATINSKRGACEDEDKKPTAIASHPSVQNDVDLLKLSADLLPDSPVRPTMAQSFTVPESVDALNDWRENMEHAQATFVNRVEKNTQQVTEVFNSA
jgi:hypothetical protein